MMVFSSLHNQHPWFSEQSHLSLPLRNDMSKNLHSSHAPLTLCQQVSQRAVRTEEIYNGSTLSSRAGLSQSSETELYSSSVPKSIVLAATSTARLLGISATVSPMRQQHTAQSGFSGTRQTKHFCLRGPLLVQYSEVNVSASYSFVLGKLLIQSLLKSSGICPDMK